MVSFNVVKRAVVRQCSWLLVLVVALGWTGWHWRAWARVGQTEAVAVAKRYSATTTTRAKAAACPAITVSSFSQAATPPEPVYQTFTASGGQAPYSFTSNVGYPLSLSTEGLLSGVLTRAGVITYAVTATDANGCTGSSVNWMNVAAVRPFAGRGLALSMPGYNTDPALTRYVEVARSPAMQNFAALTIEAWVKLGSASGRYDILNRAPISFNVQDGKPALALNGVTNVPANANAAGYVFASRAIPVGVWTHVAVTWNPAQAGQIQFYINGAVRGSHAFPGSPAKETGPLTLGYCNVCGTANTGFLGELDEVRLWSLAQSSNLISQYRAVGMIGDEWGLEAYWRFDEPSGATVRDASGHGADGTLNSRVQRVDANHFTANKNTTYTGKLFGYIASRQALSVHISQPPQKGTLTLGTNDPSDFSFQPRTDAVGNDSFVFQFYPNGEPTKLSIPVVVNFSILNNAAPEIASYDATVVQGVPAVRARVAFVRDAETAADALTILPVEVLPGITLNNFMIQPGYEGSGTARANIAAGCGVAPGNYTAWLDVSDGAATATSAVPMTITVLTNTASIDWQPVDQNVLSGSNATFSVIAKNAASYRWRKNGIPLNDGGKVSGATTTKLKLTAVSASDVADYDVVVTTACNTSVNSGTAKLRLLPSGQAPTLGAYANATVGAGRNTTITPSAAPSNATQMTACATAGFHGQLTVNPLTGAVSVANAQPPGNYTVTVIALTTGASVSTTFGLTVSTGFACDVAPGGIPGSTNPNQSVDLNQIPVYQAGLELGDFNNDGKLDFAVAKKYSTSVAVRFGDGSGNFSGTTEVGVGSSPLGLALGDLDGDGNLDFATANNTGNSVSVRLGDGRGGFPRAVDLSATTPYAIVAGDFNKDGKLDLAATEHTFNGALCVWLGNGAGQFTALPKIQTYGYPQSLVAGDFDGDGKLDLANSFGNADAVVIAVLFGDGTGGFPRATEISDKVKLYAELNSLATGDFNADGKLDLVQVSNQSNVPPTFAEVWLGRSDGSFSHAAELPIGLSPRGVVTGDFNGDGKLDFASLSGATDVTIWKGNGDGSFTGRADARGTDSGVALGTGDFNGDGKLDFIAVSVVGVADIRLGDCRPTLTIQNTISRQGDTNRTAMVATVSDPDSPLGALTLSSTAGVPPPVFAYDFVNTNGTITATLSTVACNASLGNYTDDLIVTDEHGYRISADMQFSIIANEPPKLRFSDRTVPHNAFSYLLPDEISDAGSYKIALESVTPAPASGQLTWHDVYGLVVSPVVSAGEYRVTLSATDNCLAKTTVTFMLKIGVPPQLGAYSNASVGVGNSVTVTPASAPNAVNAVAYGPPAFKGVLSVNPTTGAVFVSNAQPAGTFPITVKAMNGPSSTTQTFMLTVQSLPACANAFLSNAGASTVGTNPSAIATADFNNDGRLDFMTANSGSNTVTWGRGQLSVTGFPNFNVAMVLNVGANPQAIAVGDFNNNGGLDFITANVDDSSVSLVLGDGNGTFAVAPGIALGANKRPRGLSVGDFNGDGNLDFATANAGDNTVTVRLGDGAGNFPNSKDITVGAEPVALVTDDFNGDGKLDLVVANASGNTLSLRLGDGAGNFTAAGDVQVGSKPVALTARDFDGDGKTDLAVASNTAGTVAVLKGNGAGGFTVSTTLTLNLKLTALVASDFNGDGKLDLAVAASDSNSVSQWQGDGAGNFTRQADVNVGNGQSALATGDFNPDGLLDLLAAIPTTNGLARRTGTSVTPALFYTAQSVVTGNPLTITPASGLLAAGTVSAVTVQNVSPALASGITVSNTGEVTVAAIVPSNVYTVTIRATGNCGVTTDATFQLVVGPPPTLGNYPNVNVTAGGNVTITPSAMPANTYSATASAPGFTGLLMVNPTTGVVTVSNAAPAGTHTVTVTGLGGSRVTKTFTLTVTSPQSCNNASFNAVATPALSAPLAVGDFNGDGKLDLVTGSGANLVIQTGNGAGSFTTGAVVTLGTAAPSQCAVSDFNGDGKADLAVSNFSEKVLYLRLGNGDGTFSVGPKLNFSAGVSSLVAQDFNGDGKPDLALTMLTSVLIRLGDGTGNFTSGPDILPNVAVNGLKAGDFNNDGQSDFAFVSGVNNKIVIGLNSFKSGGSFTLSEFPIGTTPSALTLGDFNNDGKLDFAVASAGGTISLRLGNGSGGVMSPAPPDISIGVALGALTAGDFDGDGKLDFAGADSSATSPAMHLRLGDGAGGVKSSAMFAVAVRQNSLTVADFNRDGKQDLITTSIFTGSGTLWLNSCYAPPTLAAVAPLTRTAGAAATNAAMATVTNGAAPFSVTANTGATGISVSNIVVANGVVSADVAASLAASPGAKAVTLNLTDSQGGTASAQLTVNVLCAANAISAQPTARNVFIGQSTSFTVTASGTGLSYQWRKNGATLTDTNGFSGAKTAALTLQPVTAASAGNYDVIITNSCGQAVTSSSAALTVTAPLLVNEFRFSGPGSGTLGDADNWYVELYNNTEQDIPTTGLKLNWINAAGNQNGVVAFTAGGTIKRRGYYLIGGSAYSLAVPRDEIALALGSAGLLGGVQICNAAGQVLDAAGTTDVQRSGQTQFNEGTPVAALGLTSTEHAWVRRIPSGGNFPQDTQNNQNDFVLVATTTAEINGEKPKLGTPGPQNSTTPPVANAVLPMTLFAPTVSSTSQPNFLRDATPILNGPQGSYASGVFYLRRTFTNNTGGPVRVLRARIVDITDGTVTGQANIRALNASGLTLNGVSVAGVTVDTPAQSIGGGLNASLTVLMPLNQSIPDKGTISVQFCLGVISGGSYRFFVNLEAGN